MTTTVQRADCEDQKQLCDGKFKSQRSLVSSLLVIAGIGVFIVSGAACIGVSAYGRANAADSRIGEHIAAGSERNKSIDATLIRLEKKMDEYFKGSK